ncbi:hypothetical protein [Modestobacter sp. SSW1-42]|uniref:hypothetical protein n=1 Tax=Modestobacter sp. SSW1-42 TaxID=596372 RepID=UPI003986AE4D
MTASPATATWWGGVPAADLVTDAHLLAAVDEALAGSGTGAELVCLHEDRPAPGSRTGVRIGVALRLTGEPADPAATRAALAAALSGPVLTPGDEADDASAPARTALTEAGAGSAGRAVRFPGLASVRGRLTVADLVATTGIDRVRGLYGPVADTAVVETGPHGFVRPRWEDGELTLLVEPVAGGLLQPFEIESPHQCCGGEH